MPAVSELSGIPPGHQPVWLMAIELGCIQTCPSGSVPSGPFSPRGRPSGSWHRDAGTTLGASIPSAAPAQLSIPGWGGAATPALTPQAGGPCPHPTDPERT